MPRLAFAIALLLTIHAGAATTQVPQVTGRRSPALAAALEHYRAIARNGGWPALPDGPTLHPGDRDPAVALLRARLRVTGDLVAGVQSVGGAEPASDHVYTDPLGEAVRAFQRRHGLEEDGLVGVGTRAALNVPVERRIEQLELALARMAAEAPPDEPRYVRVNVPGFWLELIENGETTLEMPVVVGKPSRPTPTFRSAITFLVLNPTWTIPAKLAHEDMLPKAVRDPDYFRTHGIHVFGAWRRDADEIDPDWIDWTLIGRSIRTLKLRQAPGPENPLGRIKFHLPNPFDVYLHDSPTRTLFARDRRAYSSGCIRLGDAHALARELLAGHPTWPPERFDEALAEGVTTRVYLHQPMPVHVVYHTAWADEDGTVQFREDLYDTDRTVARELAERGSGQPSADALGQLAPAARSERHHAE